MQQCLFYRSLFFLKAAASRSSSCQLAPSYGPGHSPKSEIPDARLQHHARAAGARRRAYGLWPAQLLVLGRASLPNGGDHWPATGLFLVLVPNSHHRLGCRGSTGPQTLGKSQIGFAYKGRAAHLTLHVFIARSPFFELHFKKLCKGKRPGMVPSL